MSARSSLCIVPNSAPSNGARSPTCSATSCSCTTCVSSSFGSTESTSDRRMCRSFDPIPFTRSATTCVASVRLMSDNTSSNPASRSSRESARSSEMTVGCRSDLSSPSSTCRASAARACRSSVLTISSACRAFSDVSSCCTSSIMSRIRCEAEMVSARRESTCIRSGGCSSSSIAFTSVSCSCICMPRCVCSKKVPRCVVFIVSSTREKSAPLSLGGSLEHASKSISSRCCCARCSTRSAADARRPGSRGPFSPISTLASFCSRLSSRCCCRILKRASLSWLSR
mmetsp:Transcript_40049/g.116829  ORF Transcript_40049/g.116829 Transcript_40049/m.116829 type:complete len:284 (-) Transcript_40049:105-956(-)